MTGSSVIPWLTIIGMGEDGAIAYSPQARHYLDNAEVVVGAPRFLKTLPSGTAEHIPWPHPLSSIIPRLTELAGRRVVALATGDPLHFGVGRLLIRHFNASELQVFPHISAFSLAAARLTWPLETASTLTVHGRADSLIERHIHPEARLIVLTGGDDSIRRICRRLRERGFGGSAVTAFSHMNGKKEQHLDFTPDSVPLSPFPALTTLGIHCHAGPNADIRPAIPGLPDDAFAHDGQLTKQDVRVATLAALSPSLGDLLWDIGAGCGSLAIEWLCYVNHASAVAFESHPSRIALIRRNMDRLGAPDLMLATGRAPESFRDQPPPDAVFIGGGVTDPELAEQAFSRLKPGGRLVANAVTLEGQARLSALARQWNGNLRRFDIAILDRLGEKSVLRPRLGVIQLRAVRPRSAASS